MFEKLAKFIFRRGWYVGSGIKTYNERKKGCDSEIQQYIRPKRSYKNLPDNWTDTHLIKLDKSWKKRSKVRHQWEKHKLSKFEQDELYDNYTFTKQQLLFKLSKKSVIYICDLNSESFRPVDYTIYNAAEQLVKDDIVDPIYEIKTWTFNDFGQDQIHTRQILIGIKAKNKGDC